MRTPHLGAMSRVARSARNSRKQIRGASVDMITPEPGTMISHKHVFSAAC